MYGLVLQGGGTKGSYEVGVWKALRELEIDIQAVTGTSIGALIGAMITQDRYDELYELWFNLSPNSIFTGDEAFYQEVFSLDVSFSKMDVYYDNFKKVLKNRGLDVTPLKEMISNFCDEDAIRKSHIDFGLVTYSLSDMEPIEIFKEDIPKGQMANFLFASAYVPGFKLETLDGKYYVDGGIHDNLPVSLMEKKGYDKIIAVGLRENIVKKTLKKATSEVTSIIPSDDVGTMFNFDLEKVRRNIEMGYLDTLKVFERVQGTRYYLHSLPTEDEVMSSLLKIDDNDILETAKKMGFSEGNATRLLFEKIIPEIARLFGYKQKVSYCDLLIGFMETIADIYNIERLQIYSFIELELEIKSKLNNKKINRIDYDLLPDPLKNSYLLKYTFKEDLLVEIARLLLKDTFNK
jgi:NTE family protein